MTPNPQNIGAAPEEYRDLVPGEIIQSVDEVAPGSGTRWWPVSDSIGEQYDPNDHWPMRTRRPSPDAVGVPEAKPKGPSLPEVTQPGEGVDLDRLEQYAGSLEQAEALALIAEIRSLRSALEGLYDKGWTKEAIEAARVALRRESK